MTNSLFWLFKKENRKLDATINHIVVAMVKSNNNLALNYY